MNLLVLFWFIISAAASQGTSSEKGMAKWMSLPEKSAQELIDPTGESYTRDWGEVGSLFAEIGIVSASFPYTETQRELSNISVYVITRMPELLDCFEMHPESERKTVTTVAIRFVVTQGGGVRVAWVYGSDIRAGDATECMADVFESIHFPRMDDHQEEVDEQVWRERQSEVQRVNRKYALLLEGANAENTRAHIEKSRDKAVREARRTSPTFDPYELTVTYPLQFRINSQ